MSVVSREYGGLGGAGMEVVGGKLAGHSQEELVAYQEMSEHILSAS